MLNTATTKRNKLNAIYKQVPPGTPLTSTELAKLGVSADLAVHYARSGWLTRLARGVYSRAGDTLSPNPSLKVLEAQLVVLDSVRIGPLVERLCEPRKRS